MLCLRYRCSERYQRISLLHRSFQAPLCPSSFAVYAASQGLSPWILPRTNKTADRHALRPINPDNARGLCITAAAGRVVEVRHAPKAQMLKIEYIVKPCRCSKLTKYFLLNISRTFTTRLAHLFFYWYPYVTIERGLYYHPS